MTTNYQYFAELFKPTTRRLLLGQVKAGKTFSEIQRMYLKGNGFLNIIVVLNSTSAVRQTFEQCLEVGFIPENILTPKDLKHNKGVYSSLNNKILIVNINKAYSAKVCDLISEAHSQSLRINYTSDEYDLTAALLNTKKAKAFHKVERRWLLTLREDDIYTAVSATNAVGYYSRLDWTEVKIVFPWSTSYKGLRETKVVTLDDMTAANLADGKIYDNLIARIKSQNTCTKKALIKVTNLVNYNTDNDKTLLSIRDQLLAKGVNAVAMYANNVPSQEEYDSAVVVVAGQLANRTIEFKNIYTQYLDFGADLWDAAIIQSLRLLGARDWTPILYISQSKRPRLDAAIKEELRFLDAPPEFWKLENRQDQIIDPNSIPLPSKIAGQSRQKLVAEPQEILELEEYVGRLAAMYPMIDDLVETSRGTRIYGNHDLPYVIKNVINTFSKSRIQPDRNLLLPDNNGVLPVEGTMSKAIKLGVYYQEGMTQFAAYYVDPTTYELKIALWQLTALDNKGVKFSVQTENRTAA